MTFLRSTLVLGFLLTFFACAESGDAPNSDDDSVDEAGETDKSEDDDDSTPSTGGKKDASTSNPAKDASTSNPAKDAGKSEPKDSGTSGSKDSGSSQTADAGKGAVDAGKDAGGGFMFPDLFPTSDAGSGTKTDAAVGAPGDKSGPCKDLQLLCFDPIDMFIFNPSDCFTCNGGKGCQGCAIPFAY
jgi:hypothetical protein